SLSRACVRIPRSAQGSPVPRVKWGQTRSLHDDVRCAEGRTPADHYWCHQQDHRDFHAFHANADLVDDCRSSESTPWKRADMSSWCGRDVRYGSMLLKKDFEGVSEQY